MQLRYDTQLTIAEYISTEAWGIAALSVCPNHPNGGCALTRHGTYARKCDRGRIAHIARCHCADSHTTFSLLPDCLAARRPGSLKQFEQIAVVIETRPRTARSDAALSTGRPKTAQILLGSCYWLGNYIIFLGLVRIEPNHRLSDLKFKSNKKSYEK